MIYCEKLKNNYYRRKFFEEEVSSFDVMETLKCLLVYFPMIHLASDLKTCLEQEGCLNKKKEFSERTNTTYYGNRL